jgi:phenylpropionate dioxygenase-like ring-hydroxylating dioxygenase large terminal subunit
VVTGDPLAKRRDLCTCCGEMFDGFANVWTAATARRLTAAPLAVKIAGEDVVLFRDATGRARAFLDRCPHRGVKLSLGTVSDGCLACPFHGWRFEGDGSVRGVPYNPDARLGLLRATVLPCEEHHGVIYVHTAPTLAGAAAPPLELPGSLTRPDVTLVTLEVTWRTHWTRAMENMLDWPHLPFVHAGSIGRDLKRKLRPQSRMDVHVEKTEFGASSSISLDGERQKGGLDWVRPNMMVLHIDPPGVTFKMHVACIPVDDATTRMLIVSTRSFLRSRLLSPLFTLSNRKIIGEDRLVVESSTPSEVPEPGVELSVRTDALPLLFRKHYHDELKRSSARPLPVHGNP